MSRVLSALNNTIRLRLLRCLSQRPKSVSEMISVCGLSQSAVSQHLSKLREAGLVSTEKMGKTVYYSLAYPQLKKITEILDTFIKQVET